MIRNKLPGGPDAHARGNRMVRIDHSGELAAVQICKAQLAVLGVSKRTRRAAEKVREMAEQEQEHLRLFNELLPQRRARPSALTPLWSALAYGLGATTALLGPKAAMACTEAIEDTIEQHYIDQTEALDEKEAELKVLFARLAIEEGEHKDTAVEEGAQQALFYRGLTKIIKVGCRMGIRICERV